MCEGKNNSPTNKKTFPAVPNFPLTAEALAERT